MEMGRQQPQLAATDNIAGAQHRSLEIKLSEYASKRERERPSYPLAHRIQTQILCIILNITVTDAMPASARVHRHAGKYTYARRTNTSAPTAFVVVVVLVVVLVGVVDIVVVVVRLRPSTASLQAMPQPHDAFTVSGTGERANIVITALNPPECWRERLRACSTLCTRLLSIWS